MNLLGTMRKALPVILLLASATLALGQTRTMSLQLGVEVRPAMRIALVGDSQVDLTIRLAPAAQASIWRADLCGAAPANSRVVSQNGRVQIPVSELGTGSKVCAISSDGALMHTLALPTAP